MFLWNWFHFTGACVKEVRPNQDTGAACYTGTSSEKMQGHDTYLQEDWDVNFSQAEVDFTRMEIHRRLA